MPRRHDDDFVDPHSYATELVLVASQTVFYVLLFVLLKQAFVDQRGMMSTYDTFRENGVQLFAIFFAIFTILLILLIPLHSYEYVDVVIGLTLLCIGIYMGAEIHRLKKGQSTLTSMLPLVMSASTKQGPLTKTTVNHKKKFEGKSNKTSLTKALGIDIPNPAQTPPQNVASTSDGSKSYAF